MRGYAGLLALLLVAVGCAGSPVRKTQRVRISTFPPGATVVIEGRKYRAPATVALDRDREYTVRAELNGFQPVAKRIRRKRVGRAGISDYLLLGVPLLWKRSRPPRYVLEPSDMEIMLEPEGWSPR